MSTIYLNVDQQLRSVLDCRFTVDSPLSAAATGASTIDTAPLQSPLATTISTVCAISPQPFPLGDEQLTTGKLTLLISEELVGKLLQPLVLALLSDGWVSSIDDDTLRFADWLGLILGLDAATGCFRFTPDRRVLKAGVTVSPFSTSLQALLHPATELAMFGGMADLVLMVRHFNSGRAITPRNNRKFV